MLRNPYPTELRRRWRRVIVALALGISAGLFTSAYWLVDLFPADSRQLILLTALVSLAGSVGYWAIQDAAFASLRATTGSRRAWIALLSVLVGAFMFYCGTSQWQKSGRHVGFLLPKEELRLTVVGAPTGTRLVWLNTSLGDIPYESLDVSGWERRGDILSLNDPTKNTILWRGKTGEQFQLVLESPDPGGNLVMAWSDVVDQVPLDSRRTSYIRGFDLPWWNSSSLVMAMGVLNFSALALGLVLLGRNLLTSRQGIAFLIDPVRDKGGIDRADWLILGGMMVVALLLRASNLGRMFPAVDEYYQLIAADQLLAGASLDAVYSRGLWTVTVPVALALRTFGHELWAARSIGVLVNVLAMIPLFLLSRKIHQTVAFVTLALYATSPWIITFSRVAREYAYYPFYFYWIAWLMVTLVEAIPSGFVVRTQWPSLLQRRFVVPAVLLLVPPIFGLKIDWLSTFRTILIAYVVLGAFILARFNWRQRSNWPYLAASGVAFVAIGAFFYREQVTKLLLLPRVNAVPLGYFFPNPPQQWYFDRLTIVVVVSVVWACAVSYLHRRVNFVPLFFICLLLASLCVFALFSKSFFHTRHLMSTEFWYVVVVGMGLSWLWSSLRHLISGWGRWVVPALAVLVMASVVNVNQVLLPSLSTDPDMPISEDYMHDMSDVQGYMLGHAKSGDAVVSTVYGLYAMWEGRPEFGEQYRINAGTSIDEIAAMVEAHPRGWLVIDSIRLDMSRLSVRQLTSLPQMEYIGIFGDEHVWRWGGQATDSAAAAS